MTEKGNWKPAENINVGEETFKVYQLPNNEGTGNKALKFQSIIAGHGIILDLNTKVGRIMKEDSSVVVSFKYDIKDGLFDVNKIKDVKKDVTNNGLNEEEFIDIKLSIKNYLINHPGLLINKSDKAKGDELPVYSLEERKNPDADDEVALDFQKQLHDKYDSDIVQYFYDVIPNLIIGENENIIKITLACIATILGIYSYFIQLLGDSGIGKSYDMKIVLEYIIPNRYILNMNDIKEAAFNLLCSENPRFFEGLILNFGDLGNRDKWKKLAAVYDIIKELISEGTHIKFKSEQEGQNNNWDYTWINIFAESIAAIYGTVVGDEGDGNDAKGQIESRTINVTPQEHSEEEMAHFSEGSKTYGTYGYDKFQKAKKSLLDWQEHLKMRIKQFDPDRYILVMPFTDMFLRILKFSKVKIRDYQIFSSLLKTLTYLNLERSITFKKDDHIFVLPCLEDVKNFIHIMSDNIGLTVAEKRILLKMKKEFGLDFDIINASKHLKYNTEDNEKLTVEDHYDRIIQTCIATVLAHPLNNDGYTPPKTLEDFIPEFYESDNKTMYYQNKPGIFDTVYEKYGLTAANRRKNKKVLKEWDKGNNPDALQDYIPIIFFRVPNIKTTYKSDSVIKNVPDIATAFHKFTQMGFFNKLDYKVKNANVYYVNPLILNIDEEYKMTPEDRIEALATLMKEYHVFSEEDIKRMCKEYQVQYEVVKEYIAAQGGDK